MNHSLKTWPEHFEAVNSGSKPYELRKADRNYQVGDLLCLQEFKPCPVCLGVGEVKNYGAMRPCCPAPNGTYTGRSCERKVTHVLHGPVFGLAEGWVILSFGTMGADQPRRRDHR